MADDARAQRMAAIAEKKRRLEEMKARKTQRASVAAQPREVPNPQNLNEYIDGLLKAPAASGTPAPGPAVEVPADVTTSTEGAKEKSSADAKPSVIDKVIASETAAASVSAAAVPSKQVETFEIGTQVMDDDFPPPSDYGDDDIQQEQVQAGDQEQFNADTSYRNYPEEEKEDTPKEAKILSAEEVEQELASETFSLFLNAASKKVERVLGSPVLADLFTDYGEADATNRAMSKASDGSKFLSSRQVYECSKWTSTRDVTDMDWSPLHRELMLTSYHMPSSTSSLTQTSGSAAVSALSPDDTPSSSMAPRSGELQSDGLVLVWSLAMPTRPEHIFTCGSPVTTARFHPTESPLVIGGCQSGQVVVWDVRAGRMPVQKSSLVTSASGGKGHTHPIIAMEVIESGVSESTCIYPINLLFIIRDPLRRKLAYKHYLNHLI
jgi:dynein intermediate chain, cytosolic